MSLRNELSYQYEDCYAAASAGMLVIGNAYMEQSFDLSRGIPVPVSLRNKQADDEWLEGGAGEPLYVLQTGEGSRTADAMYLKADTDDDYGNAVRHARIMLDIPYPASLITVRVVWKLYPNCPFTQQEVMVKQLQAVEARDPEGWQSLHADDIRRSGESERAGGETDYVHCLPLRDVHCRYEVVQLLDVTDHHNDLAHSRKGLLFPKGRKEFDGNIAFLEKLLQPSGLLVIKEGPTSIARLGSQEADFHFLGKRLYVKNTGFASEEAFDERYLSAYGSAVGVYDGGEEQRYRLLDAYHRHIHAERPERDYFFMSNNWGDRSKDGRVSESFLLAELEAAARIGITHYQIDDGWQTGATINSVHAEETGGGRWSGYYASGYDFWAPHPERLPRGFEPIAAFARELEIRLCLWFSPDSDQDLANWERDAETLVLLHRTYGISHFKLDGIHLTGKRGERNLLRLMQRVVAETGNGVYFNLDTTDQVRLGYYGRTQYAALFLENRYTDWANYYPHWTLRNLWMLSKYVPARKLQIEFLNVRRNTGKYGDDPLAPHACGLLYCAAASLFANPLAWMELTGLTEADADHLAGLLRLVGPHHRRIMSGHILPIGDEPSGSGWTGLQSVTEANREGYVLVFRERCGETGRDFKLWGLESERLQLDLIAGGAGGDEPFCGKQPAVSGLSPDSEGRYLFELPSPFSFSLYRYSTIPG